MPVKNGAIEAVANVQELGVAIKRTGPNQQHVGFLYKIGANPVRLCHLMYHCKLDDREPDQTYDWVQFGFLPESRRVIAAYVAAVSRNRGNIPYGIDAAGSCFNAEGEFIQPPLGKGLTCSTFITAVLKSLGHQLTDDATWPNRAEDEEFQARIMDLMRKFGASDDHVAAALKDVGAKRLRPEEAAAAATLDEDATPATFATARAIADQIMTDLRPFEAA